MLNYTNFTMHRIKVYIKRNYLISAHVLYSMFLFNTRLYWDMYMRKWQHWRSGHTCIACFSVTVV